MQTINKYKVPIILFLAVIVCYAISKYIKQPKNNETIQVQTSPYNSEAKRRIDTIDSMRFVKSEYIQQVPESELQLIIDSVYNRQSGRNQKANP